MGLVSMRHCFKMLVSRDIILNASFHVFISLFSIVKHEIIHATGRQIFYCLLRQLSVVV